MVIGNGANYGCGQWHSTVVEKGHCTVVKKGHSTLIEKGHSTVNKKGNSLANDGNWKGEAFVSTVSGNRDGVR